MPMYRCDKFAIHELVPPAVFRRRGDSAWELLDDRMLVTLDRLRKRYGKMTANDYIWSGPREWSGLRTPDSPYYSAYSQHTFGRACDIIFSEITAEEVRQDIISSPDLEEFEFIGSIELSVSWLHYDVRNCRRIKNYYP